jgi:hypothetical protein
MEIKINGTNLQVKYTLRGYFVFEQLTGKPFDIKGKLDEYIFMYSLLIANNPDILLTLQDFIDACDKDSSIAIEFQKLIVNEIKIEAQYFQKEEEKSDKKKA